MSTSRTNGHPVTSQSEEHGFAVDLSDLHTVANTSLPDLASMMSAGGQELYVLKSVGASKLSGALCRHGDVLAGAVMAAAAAVEDTARTLQDIWELYQRADGQDG